MFQAGEEIHEVDLSKLVSFVLTLDARHARRVSEGARGFLTAVRTMDADAFEVLALTIENCQSER